MFMIFLTSTPPVEYSDETHFGGMTEELSMLQEVVASTKDSRKNLAEELDGLPLLRRRLKSEEIATLSSKLKAADLEKVEQKSITRRSHALDEMLGLGDSWVFKDVKDYHLEAKKIYDEASKAFYKLEFLYISLLVEKADQILGELVAMDPPTLQEVPSLFPKVFFNLCEVHLLCSLGWYADFYWLYSFRSVAGRMPLMSFIVGCCKFKLKGIGNLAWLPVALSAIRTALMHSFEAARYMIKILPALGAMRVGSFSMYHFISLKALPASLFHVKSFFSRQPFNVLKKGRDFSALLDSNLLRAVSLPFRLCTSLMVFGYLRLVNA
ncbi:hypothetical protein Tco_1299311 [Tanacetum coccineum]